MPFEMEATVFIPSSPAKLVREICHIKASANEKILRHFVPPLGVPELLIFVGNPNQLPSVPVRRALLKGQFLHSEWVDFLPDYQFISIRLQATGLYQLFGWDASLWVDAVLDLELTPLWPLIRDLCEDLRLVDADFCRLLLARLEKAVCFEPSAELRLFLNAAPELLLQKSLQGQLASLGISPRTLERKCKKEMGLSPKKYLRILRMNLLEMQSMQKPAVEWMDMVAEFDFSDSSHLNKEIRALRSYSPKELIDKKLRLGDQLPAPNIKEV